MIFSNLKNFVPKKLAIEMETIQKKLYCSLIFFLA